MWLFIADGFYSVVADYENGELLVRARTRRDIESLRDKIAEEEGYTVDYRETPERDYAYRIEGLPRDILARIVSAEIRDIEYHNFKSEVHKRDPSPERARAYMDVWGAMVELQSRV